MTTPTKRDRLRERVQTTAEVGCVNNPAGGSDVGGA